MIFNVGPLFAPQEARKELKQDIAVEVALPSNWEAAFVPCGVLRAKLTAVRMQNDVLVLLKNVSIAGEIECGKCFKKEVIELAWESSEQIFYAKKPKIWGEEEFFIDPSGYKINLTPFLQQEIAVHTPLIFEHSPEKCDPEVLQKLRATPKMEESTPFAELKNLLQIEKNTQKHKKSK